MSPALLSNALQPALPLKRKAENELLPTAFFA
jgi:hypothetical protein